MEPRISAITLGVSDLERSYRFYKEGLGLANQMTPAEGIVFFLTSGTLLVIYPYDKLAEDAQIPVSPEDIETVKFPGFTLSHTMRKKEDVDTLLETAERAGGKIIKKAQDVFWGGYSGYFADPDGYLWEVNCSDIFTFNPDGSIAFK